MDLDSCLKILTKIISDERSEGWFGFNSIGYAFASVSKAFAYRPRKVLRNSETGFWQVRYSIRKNRNPGMLISRN